MRFGEKLAIFFIRPIWRTFFERLFWWFLARIKVFMLGEIGVQLANIENACRALENIERRLQALEESRSAISPSDWNALEDLILSLLNQPHSRPAAPLYINEPHTDLRYAATNAQLKT